MNKRLLALLAILGSAMLLGGGLATLLLFWALLRDSCRSDCQGVAVGLIAVAMWGLVGAGQLQLRRWLTPHGHPAIGPRAAWWFFGATIGIPFVYGFWYLFLIAAVLVIPLNLIVRHVLGRAWLRVITAKLWPLFFVTGLLMLAIVGFALSRFTYDPALASLYIPYFTPLAVGFFAMALAARGLSDPIGVAMARDREPGKA